MAANSILPGEVGGMPSAVPDANPFGLIGQVIQSIIQTPGEISKGKKEGGAKGAAKAGASSIGGMVSELMGAVGDSIAPDGRISVSTLLDLGGKRTAMRKEREMETKLNEMRMQRAEQELNDYPLEYAKKVLGLQEDIEGSTPDVQDQIASILAPPPAEVAGMPTTEDDQAQYAQGQAALQQYGLDAQARERNRLRYEDAGATLEATGLPKRIIATLSPKERQAMLTDYAKDGWTLARQKELARYENSLPSKVGPSAAKKAWMEYQDAMDSGQSQQAVYAAREAWINSLKGNTQIMYQNPQTGENFSGSGPEVAGYMDKIRMRTIDDRILAVNESNRLIDETLSIMSPGNMGIGGALRQNWQNAAAQLGSAGSALFQQQQALAVDLYSQLDPSPENEDLRRDLGRSVPGSPYYDPNIPALDSMFTILAYKQARALDPSGRLAKEDVELAQSTIGNPKLAYPDAVSRLRQAKTANQIVVENQYRARQAMLASQGDNPMRAAARRMEAQRGYVPVEQLSDDDLEALYQDPMTPPGLRQQIEARMQAIMGAGQPTK